MRVFGWTVTAAALTALPCTFPARAEAQSPGHAHDSSAVIRADSIVPTTPSGTLSALMAGRIPGVQVMSTSGALGSGSRIRIRGTSTRLLSADPIVVVDGVRVDAAFSQPTFALWSVTAPNSNMLAPAVNATSRLDDIDPEMIESIEVLKGPAASSRYGNDAANGVIVVTTKRGRPGATRWSFSTQQGISQMPAEFADAWRGWGHSPLNQAPECTPTQVVQGLCMLDSLTHYNPLNASATSPFGTGRTALYGAQLSGGSTRFQYFLGANYRDDVGLVKLPDASERAFVEQRDGAALPGWARNPNVLRGTHVTSTVGATLGHGVDVTLNGNILHQYHQDVPGGAGGLIAASYNSLGYRDSVGLGWGDAQPATTFLTRTSDLVRRGFGGGTVRWRPGGIFDVYATTGLDLTRRTDEQMRPGDILPTIPVSISGRGDMRTAIQSFDIGTHVELSGWNGIRLRTTAGVQSMRQTTSIEAQSSAGIMTDDPFLGTISGYATQESGSSMGWYAEETAALREGLFVTAGVRGDAGNDYWQTEKSAFYPKVSASWLLSREPLAQGLHLPATVRLHGAFGRAGVQPSLDTRVPLSVGGTPLPGVPAVTFNDQLARSTEYEGGLELGWWHDRVTADATLYRKTTDDAFPAASTVRNRGIEASATLVPLAASAVRWEHTIIFAHNGNTLTRLTTYPGIIDPNDPSRPVQNYPVGVFWQRPLLGYTDADGDGYIMANEIRMGDSATYAGQPLPKNTASWDQTLTLFSGRLSVATGFDYVGDFSQYNVAFLNQCRTGRCQGAVGPNMSLASQAEALSTQTSAGFGMERASWLRWQSFSMTVAAPASITRRLRGRSATVSLMGRNLALWTHYRGPDPEVNSSTISTGLEDDGALPQPREWSIRINLGY